MDYLEGVQEMRKLVYQQEAVDSINKALDRETLLNSFVRKVAVDAVKVLPPVDAVPVVRCRDCKRYQHEVGDDEYALGWCPFITVHLVSGNEFCSYGKRKEDGNEVD